MDTTVSWVRGQLLGRFMKRWAEIAGSGLLALASLGTLTWAGPRRAAEIARSEVLSPAPEPSSTGDNKDVHANFPGKLPIHELSEQEAILHALNRLGFGPRPGQVEQIEKTGLENWIQAPRGISRVCAQLYWPAGSISSPRCGRQAAGT
jgi:hypothetical protein